jgi:hypothetical protein
VVQEDECGWAIIATEDPDARGGAAWEGAPDEPAFRARLDELLSSALAEQAREQEGFMKVIQSSRDALAAVRSELGGVRELVERRDHAVVALLRERLPDADAEENIRALSRRVETLDDEHASLKRSISVKLDSVAGSVEAMEWRIQESLAALAGRVSELERRGEEHAARMEAALKDLGEGVETRQQEVAHAILDALDPVGRIMQLVQGRLARAASELAIAQASLFSRLAEREERLERQRDQILSDLLDEFAGNLKPRERNRIAAELREADEIRRNRRDAGRKHDGASRAEGWVEGGQAEGLQAEAGRTQAATVDEVEADPFAGSRARLRRGRKPAL